MKLLSWLKPSQLPDRVSAALDKGEVVLGHVATTDGVTLSATRNRLLVIDQDSVTSLSWSQIASAKLSDGVLTIVPLVPIGEQPDGAQVVHDGVPQTFGVGETSKLTDQVHHRVRGSVVASEYLPWPGAGGWVTTRKVAGQDGLLLQLRLDPDADPESHGFLEAAGLVAKGLLGQQASGPTGADD